jgi:Dynein heavy chain C-terminal domain
MRWFANPKGLLEAITLDAAYRRAPSTKFDDIIMTFKITNIFERNIEQLSDEEYHVYGLKVKNGYIDKTKAELTDKMDPSCTDEFPAILVQCRYAKRAGGEKTESKGYMCPVVSAYEHIGQQAKEQTVLFKLVSLRLT